MADHKNVQFCPVHAGEILLQLRTSGFTIEPGTYIKVLEILQHFFPQGFRIYTNESNQLTISNDDKILFRQVVGPIIVSSDAEQQRFLKWCNEYSAWIQPFMSKSQTIEQIVEESRKEENVKNNLRYLKQNKRRKFKILIFGGMVLNLLLCVLLWELIRWNSIKDHINIQVIHYDSNWRLKSFLPAPRLYERSDQVVWEIEGLDSPQTIISGAIDITFQDSGLYKVRATKRTRLDPILSVIVGKNELQSTDSTNLWVAPPRQSNLLKTDEYKPELQLLKEIKWENYEYYLSASEVVVLVAILLVISWVILSAFKTSPGYKESNTDSPLFFSFPNQNHLIFPEAYLDSWVQKLNQRQESERHLLDIRKSIRAMIDNPALPSIKYATISDRPSYLFLVDISNVNDQQIHLTRYFIEFLESNDTELTVFYFKTDPRVCWNEIYTAGTGLDKLATLFSNRRLVVFSRPENFINFAERSLYPWVFESFSSWPSKAILTNYDVQFWGTPELLVSELFLTLPITSAGKLKLGELFNRSTLPQFDELIANLKLEKIKHRQSDFPRNIKEITCDQVVTFLSGDNDVNSVTDKRLLQWAFATGLYSVPTWEVTLAIGKAIEKLAPQKPLLTTSNLIRITALPWLHVSAIPEALQTELLKNLDEKCRFACIKAIEDLLGDRHFDYLPIESVAYEEKKIRMAEVQTHSSDKEKKLSGLSTLRSFINSALIKDGLALASVGVQKRNHIKGVIFYASLAICVYILTSAFFLIGMEKQMELFKKESVDSATYYNNRAVSIFSKDVFLNNDTTYTTVVNLLKSALSHREDFSIVYNLQAIKYNMGIYYYRLGFRGDLNRVFSQGEKAVMDILFKPIELTQNNSGFVPTQLQFSRYLKYLNESSSNFTNAVLMNSFVDTIISGEGIFSSPDFQLALTRAKNRLVQPEISMLNLFTNNYDSIVIPSGIMNNIQGSRLDTLIEFLSLNTLLYKGGPKKATPSRREIGPGNLVQNPLSSDDDPNTFPYTKVPPTMRISFPNLDSSIISYKVNSPSVPRPDSELVKLLETKRYTTSYLNEEGQLLWFELNPEKDRIMVIRTIKNKDELEVRGISKMPLENPYIGPILNISKSLQAQVEKLVMQGLTNDRLVLDNIIEVPSIKVLRNMRVAIQDNGNGGTNSANNREYGGYLIDDIVLGVTRGPVINLANAESKGLVLAVPSSAKIEFHSHPSGGRADSILTTGFYQPPSQMDILAVEHRLGICFGMASKIIYVYNRQGILATLPLSIIEEGVDR